MAPDLQFSLYQTQLMICDAGYDPMPLFPYWYGTNSAHDRFLLLLESLTMRA